MWALLRGTGRCNRHSLPLEAKGKTVVEEKQLAVRQQTAEQGVQALALQQDLRGRRRVSDVTTPTSKSRKIVLESQNF